MEATLVLLIVFGGIMTVMWLIASCAMGIGNIYGEGIQGNIVKNYLHHAKMLSLVKSGKESPWGYHIYVHGFEAFLIHTFAVIWLLLPLAIIVLTGWALTTVIGLTIIGGIVGIIAGIWGIHKGTQKALWFLGNLPNGKLAKFCSNVKKVVNSVEEKESE